MKLILPDKLPEHGIDLSNKQRKRLEAAGSFPRRVPISTYRHAYVVEEILAYVAQKIAERDGRPVEAACQR